MSKLLRFAKPYRISIVIIFITLTLEMMATLYIPTMVADIVNNGIIKKDISYVFTSGIIMLLASVLTALFAGLDTYFSAKVSTKIGKDIRAEMIHKSQQFSVSDFNEFGVASMITRTTRDVTQIEQTSIMLLQMLLPVPLMTICGLVLAFYTDAFMGLVIGATVLLFLLIAVLVTVKTSPLFDKLQSGMDAITRKLRENIIGIRIIRAFNKSHDEMEKSNKSFEEYAQLAIRVNKIFAVVLPAVMLVMNLCTFAILWLGGMRASEGYIQIGDIMALIEYSILILVYLAMGAMVLMNIPRAGASARRISAVLEHQPSITDAPCPDAKNTDADGSALPKLVFENVTFQYPDAEKPVLFDLSFSCGKGETTAIIGGTGSGKSTVASLIPRLYDIQQGSIFLDGVNICALSQHELRSRISFAPQKAFLFSGTIAENLRFGYEQATHEEIQHAARVAQADEFISNLPEKYDSAVAQAGSNFSGGQKQRLSIARTVAKKAEVYVFDDSFSALDFKTDAKLRAALKQELSQAAVIIVAQRVSTIMDATRIVVIDNGQIAGIGTHRQLLESCPVYLQIAQSQLSKEELA